MPKALRGGTLTHWRNWGEGDKQALLIHCSLGHSGAWARLAPLLDRACIAFDLPGHGQSGPLRDGVDFHAQATEMAADFLGDAPIDVIGHSFGATIALRLAMEQPARVRRLVLIEPVLMCAARGSAAYEFYEAQFAPFVAAMERGDSLAAAEFFTRVWGTGVDWNEMRIGQQTALAEQIHIVPAETPAIYDDNAGMLRDGRLESLDLPVLLLEGGQSPAIIGAILDALEPRLPNVHRVKLEEAGHMAPITHAPDVARVLREFLDA